MDSGIIKKTAAGLGADLCGIAPVGRFREAPKGFHPHDIFSRTRSVLVYARRIPTTVLDAESCIPYTTVNNILMQETDRLGLALSLALEDLGIPNVIVPSDDPFESWDPKTCHGNGVLSLRHAGYLAGLGRLGKNNLLINDRFGNMIYLGALLLAAEVTPDPIATYEACPEKCNLCLKRCPVSALDGRTVDQKRCRPLSNYKTEMGFVLQKCWECRKACPNATGIRRNVRE
ncbi:epoxyqueuosine reductase [Methanogenium organophilum]|uniref:Epoxyqueuosine reductase n=1 Tax=Methanogenium organophilum TaxID=2199 RepID=A0A9X9T9L4_METOG|nr:epoxyqueuosine reductase [Methanogenium organophilum]WAI02217.1 epoxyqueuosine reductase [Methanogenium organophilum]